MNPSRVFILRPVATTMLMVGILLAGAVGYTQLPVSALPEVDYPIIQVTTFYPGASPDVMASSVTAPLERQFGQVPGLQQMTSTSSDGSAVITLQFNLSLSIDVAEQEVQQSINASGTYLPADLPAPPIYSKTNPADTPILTLALTSTDLPLSKVEDLADTRLAPKISQLPGVGLVSISGGQKPAVRIQANPTMMASYGLNLEDLRTAIVAANVNQARGNFDGAHQAYQIGANDQLLSSSDYAPLIIAYKNGAPVKLTDVADILDDTENVRQAGWMNQTPAVILNIQRQPGANIISVVDRIKKLLPQLTSSLPASIHVSILTDRTTTIRASVSDVQFELMLTVALVVMVMFLFLRNIAATIIPGIAVPLSLVATFGVMYLLGYSLNNLSLMALTISTGFVVDDAIVMIENISRYIESGDSPFDAALKGAKQIGFTIVSLTVSLVAVLIPLLFMSGVIGRLFREFAVTLAVAIVVSAILSLTLTPMMCAYMLKPEVPLDQRSKLVQWSERGVEATLAFYKRTLSWVLDHQQTTLLVTIGTFLLTVLLTVLIPKGFFPQQDTGLLLGVTQAAPDVSFQKMMQLQQTVVDVVLQEPDVENVASFIGADGTNPTTNSGRLSISLKTKSQRTGDAEALINRLQAKLADVQGISTYLQAVQDLQIDSRFSRTQFQFTLEDADPDELAHWAPLVLAKLRTLPDLKDVASDQEAGGLTTSLIIDRDTASRLGISTQAIDDTLYDAFGQRMVSTIYTQLNLYRVILEVEPQYQRGPEALKQIYVRAPTGDQVPLSTFVTMKQTVSPLTIAHQGQFPSVTLSFNTAPGVALGRAVKAIDKATAELSVPPGLHSSFRGTAQAFGESLASEPVLILAALITVYIVLGVLYESYIHPITILSSLPSAGLGALLALMLCGVEFSVIALIGIILLIGIVKKNAIMMIDFALEAERDRGLSPRDSIFEASLLRFRPIMMTSLAALLGGVPLAIGTGTGSELRRPLGITIVGGLLISQVLTLYTTPVIYLYMERLAQWLKGRRTPRAAPSPQPAP